LADETYSSIREIIGEAIGRKIVEITQHDEDEYAETKKSYVQLHLDDGNYIKFFVGDDGFVHSYGDDEDDEE